MKNEIWKLGCLTLLCLECRECKSRGSGYQIPH